MGKIPTDPKVILDSLGSKGGLRIMKTLKEELGTPEEAVSWLLKVNDPIVAIVFIRHGWGWFSHPQVLTIVSKVIVPKADAQTALNTLDVLRQMIRGILSRKGGRMPEMIIDLYRIIAESGDEEVLEKISNMNIAGPHWLPKDIRGSFRTTQPV